MPTLSANEIVQDTLEAFKCTLGPMIRSWTTDFSSKTARLNDTITGHIRSVPATSTYHATTGYKNGAVEAETLITDVPVVLNTLKHVPVKVDYLTQLASRKNLYQQAVVDIGYSLAKTIVDATLGLCVAANFTHTKSIPLAAVDYSALEDIRKELNDQKAAPQGRFGIINPGFAKWLGYDTKLASKDFYGQLDGAQGYHHWSNVAGFQNIWEYADLPTTGSMSGFFGEPRALLIVNRLPENPEPVIDVPQIDRVYPVTDPETGLSLMGLQWREQGTRDVYFTVAALYGVAGGAQAGAADSITDCAGIIITS